MEYEIPLNAAFDVRRLIISSYSKTRKPISHGKKFAGEKMQGKNAEKETET